MMQANLDSGEKVRHRKPEKQNAPSVLAQAQAELAQFLEENPHMRPYQAEVDRLLDKSGNSQGRMAVIGTLMQGKLLEMQKELCKATLILGDAVRA